MTTAALALRILSPMERLLGPGDPGALQNIDTTILPDFALCAVLETGALYRLSRDDDSGIKPVSGPGSWFEIASS
jgi:hypothetical protein